MPKFLSAPTGPAFDAGVDARIDARLAVTEIPANSGLGFLTLATVIENPVGSGLAYITVP